jgi:ribosome-associated translation inhibitor RaiA
MDIQINTSNAIDGGGDFATTMEDMVRTRLSRFNDRLTRIEVHFSDGSTGRQTVNDKRCAIEARLAGGDPVTVTDQGSTLDLAATGAVTKMISALERHIGRSSDRKGH